VLAVAICAVFGARSGQPPGRDGIFTKLLNSKTVCRSPSPLRGSVSSLNVSVATGICLFEALRQRDAKALEGQG
jgi:tRNA(Leu) C34 or U34 (ribose-2'-O)-methylase TrmL